MENKGKRKLAAVMFTDIEGYTDLVSKNEDQALAFVRQHRQSLTMHTKANHGEIIEFYGDGSLSVYDSAVDAVQCAIAMQKDYRQSENVIPVRIGIHLGDIVQRDGSIFGNGVNVASRIESIGVAGNILVSESIADELKNQNHIDSKFLGRYAFKNVEKPLGVFGIKHDYVVMPAKKQLVGPKGKAIKSKLIPLLILGLITVVACAWYFIKGPNSKAISTVEQLKEERIAVLPFKNFTGNAGLDFIGEMSAHWLTKELLETDKANVVSFQSNDEIERLTSSSSQNKGELLASQSGALNILEGSFNASGKDSLEFSVYIKRLKSGKVRHAFQPIRFAASQPSAGIKSLSSHIKGYWDAHDDKLLTMPTFGSYKKYLQAKAEFSVDESKAQEYLLDAIGLDSTFLDPHFLLLSSYFNESNYKKAEDLIKQLKLMRTNFSAEQENMLKYKIADLQGKNKLLYEIAMKDLEQHDRSLFLVIEYMVLALNYVNAPAEVIRIYEESDLRNIDENECLFCKESKFLLASATLKLKDYDATEKILININKNNRNRGYYSRYIKLFCGLGSINKLNDIVIQAKQTLAQKNHTFVDYMAARELFINNYKNESTQYANQVIQSEKENEYLLGWVNYFIDNKEQALSHFKKEAEAYPEDVVTLGHIGAIHAMLGNSKEAASIIDQLDQMKQQYDFGDTPYSQAVIQLHLGEKDLALDLLQQAVDEGAKFYTNNVFDQDPMLQSLVDNVRFQQIIHPLDQN